MRCPSDSNVVRSMQLKRETFHPWNLLGDFMTWLCLNNIGLRTCIMNFNEWDWLFKDRSMSNNQVEQNKTTRNSLNAFWVQAAHSGCYHWSLWITGYPERILKTQLSFVQRLSCAICMLWFDVKRNFPFRIKISSINSPPNVIFPHFLDCAASIVDSHHLLCTGAAWTISNFSIQTYQQMHLYSHQFYRRWLYELANEKRKRKGNECQ